MPLQVTGDLVASLVLAKYNSLGSKGKPLVRSNGVVEGTVLAGIVLVAEGAKDAECIAVATGVKALPETIVAKANGVKLHDMHAEILVIRALNRYLLENPHMVDADVYMYVSAAPCGDASMSLLPPNGDVWPAVPADLKWIRGRNYYDAKGYIRTKPGRQDSNLTMSKSCSDKLALRQIRGLLLAPVAPVFAPKQVYLKALVCPRAQVCPDDFDRAFSRWSPDHRFSFLSTELEFSASIDNGRVASPTSLLWIKGHNQEAIVNGVRLGTKDKPCLVARRLLVDTVLSTHPDACKPTNYFDLKADSQFYPPGWVRTAQDDFSV